MLNLVHLYLDRKDFHNPTQSLAHMRLAAHVAANVSDLPINLYSYEINDFSEEELNEIAKGAIAGFSVYMWTHQKVLEIAEILSRKNPNILIVVGGHDIAFVEPEKWPKKTFFVSGEGEIPLSKICQQLVEGTLDDSKRFFDKQDFSDSSLPEGGFILFSEEFFNRINVVLDDRFPILWESSRGCPYQCGFCGHKQRNKSISFDGHRIKSEVMEIGRNQIKRVFIVDPILGGNHRGALKVLKWFKQYAPNTQLFLYFRPEHLNEVLVKLMSESNIIETSFGLQTTNEQVPDWVRKNNMVRVKQNLELLNQYHISWRLEFIIGLPGDSLRGFRKTLESGVAMRPTWMFAYQLTSVRGTKIDEIRNRTDEEYWIKTDNKNRVSESNSYSEDEMKQMLLYGNAVCGLYNATSELRLKLSFNEIDKLSQLALENETSLFAKLNPVLATAYWKEQLMSDLQGIS